MQTVQFKTNIKCSGCIAKVTLALDQVAGKDNWQVDIENPNKVLSVSSEHLSEKAIKTAIETAGFTAGKLN
jgi:copper chaperone